jgi:predicted GH43/DUF377 family glycosyl hydrolase
MSTGGAAVVIVSTLAAAGLGVLIVCALLVFGFIALVLFWWREVKKPLKLSRVRENPILEPIASHWWESQAVFNPAAVVEGGRVHVLYRAMGQDGISRIGYASSPDGIHFDERLPYPVLEPRGGFGMPTNYTYGPLSYNTVVYASGGGWGGFEDPRIVSLDGREYVTFVAFDGWGYVRMALTSIARENFLKKNWNWQKPALLSPPGEIHKNWVLFPEKINGRYAILHSIAPDVQIEYVENLNAFHDEDVHIKSIYNGKGRENSWDKRIRGAGAPPLKTRFGWLLLYHGFDPSKDGVGYKVGAMLLDLKDPSKVLARSANPILEPSEWYENDWKPGVVYATGAVVLGENLIVYYGGGDKRIAAARANLRDFVYKLLSNEHVVLEPVTL